MSRSTQHAGAHGGYCGRQDARERVRLCGHVKCRHRVCEGKTWDTGHKNVRHVEDRQGTWDMEHEKRKKQGRGPHEFGTPKQTWDIGKTKAGTRGA
eukprot:286399-Rhodomonas_salina.1